MLQDSNKVFGGSGLNQDDAPEFTGNDVTFAQNIRFSGTANQESGYATNIESNTLLAGSLPAGINFVNGGAEFNDTGQILGFRFNSAGNCQMVLYDSSTQSYQVIYTDKTDSGGENLLPLDPQKIVLAILVNKTYAIWWAKDLEVGYTNLNTLASGGYGTVLWEDLSLLKPQCLIPPTGVYGSDAGQPANFLYGNLPQFSVQYVNLDFNYSAWSTWSKRIVPYQQNTPILGADVAQNNYIIVSVNIGSIRADIVNVSCRFGLNIFYNIKSVTRAYITALPNSSVDVDTEVYEAYDSGTNTYSFAFYNNTINIPIPLQESQLNYDMIWPANAGALLNGNISAIGDWTTLYARPNTSVSVGAIGYNPNIAIPVGTFPDPLRIIGSDKGESGSGSGNHKRTMYINLTGTPHTGDRIVIIDADIRNAQSVRDYTYIVPSGLDGNLLGVVQALTPTLPSSSYVDNGFGLVYTIVWIDDPYFGGQTFAIDLFYGGASVANSVPAVPDNSQGQLSLSYRDYKGRFFPLCTGNTYQWASPSYAQVNGNAIQLNWIINDIEAPAGAVDYQWLITAPQIIKIVDTIATLLVYKDGWNAKTNVPFLATNSGNVGDTYQVTTPCEPIDTAHYTNLGHGDTYNTGGYVTDNGLSYDFLPKDFGDLTNNSILAFSLNSLHLYDSNFQQQGVNTLLAYDFTPGDRCTLHYWIGFAGSIAFFSITGGTGYTDGYYAAVPLTGGAGVNAQANVTVSGGVITAVTLTNPGTGYAVGNTLTGTIPVGSGWSITVSTLVASGNNFFNLPCIDLAVLGYDAGNYILKVENSAALTYSGNHVLYNGQQIDVRNIFLRIYTPALQNQTSQTSSQATTVWYEIGERFPIVNGQHSVLNGVIHDGGVYYKTRQFADGVAPFASPPIEVLANDLNYSDFYVSNFWSSGRTRTYYDELEKTTSAASIITSQPYIAGSRVNGLTRYYPSTIYGDGNGQTSSSQGEIQIMWPRGQELVVIQANGVFYIPVNEAYTVLNDTLTGQSITSKLLNNGRYATENVGIGTLKESFCTRFDKAYFVSPQYSEPFEINVQAGVRAISGKMSKFFKSIIQLAYQQGKKITMFYNQYYEEPTMCIQAESGILLYFSFYTPTWNPFDNYNITPSDVNMITNGAHCTASYNSMTGIITYTPAANYVGTDSATFRFDNGVSGNVTKNNCLEWLAGSGTVNSFVLLEQVGVNLSTVIASNTILVTGNDYPVAISITGTSSPQYSINGGAWTSSPGTVAPGSTVQVRLTSSGSNSSIETATLTVDGQSSEFDVVTKSAGNFTLSARYGIGIVSVTGVTGTPASFATANLTPNNDVSAAYTTLTGPGTFTIHTSGTMVIPGHERLYLAIAGSTDATVDLEVGKTIYSLPLASTQTDPTTIHIGVETF